MDGIGRRMSPVERYLRLVYLNCQVCTDVVRHYFDGLHPPTSLVQYLLDQRTKFEAEKKKIFNYQWIQLYPKVLFKADVHIKETYLESYDRTDKKDYKEFTDRIGTIFTCLFDSVDGDQKVKVVNLSRLESGEVLATLEINSQYNPDDTKIQSALEVSVNSGNVDASLETSTDGFTFSKQGVLFEAEINVIQKYSKNLANSNSNEFKAFANRVQPIIKGLYDSMTGEQDVQIVKCRQGPSDTVHVLFHLISNGNNDEDGLRKITKKKIQSGSLSLSYGITDHGFRFVTNKCSKPVSSKCFDLSLLITLLRRDSNVNQPNNGFDALPSKDEISDGAQIATIKHYRNELAHASEAKVSEHMFDDIYSKLKNAIKHLGKADAKFMKAVDDALTMKLDSSTDEVLIKMVQHDRQVLQLEEDVTELYQKLEKLTKQTEEQYSSTSAEISEIKEKIGEKEEQILENKAYNQNLYIEFHRIEKKFDEKFRVQDERNVRQDEMNKDMGSGIQGNRRGIQENRSDIQRIEIQSNMNEARRLLIAEGLENTTKQLDALELKEEIHGQEIKDLQVNQQGQTEGLANTAKQVDELKDVHGKEIKDLQVNQQNPAVRNIIDQTLATIQTENIEVYVETRAVKKCLEDLRHCPLLVLASISGRGKSALGLYLAKHFLQDDHGNYQPLLFSGNEIENKRDLIDFKKKYFIIVEDLFGSFKVRFDDEKHKFILNILNKNLRGEECNCKLILTVRKTPGSLFDLFDKHEIFKEARIIDLDDENFALTHDEKENILINHLKQFSVSICNCTYRNWFNSEKCDELCMEMPGNYLYLCYKVVKDILNFDTYYGFPQACRLFSSNRSFTKMGVKYFQNPNKALVEEIESLHNSAFKKNLIEQYQFCILVYLAVKDEIYFSTVDAVFFMPLLDKFGNSNYNPNVLKRSVKGISDKYLVGDFTKGPIRLQHATIREAILISYGKDYPDEILSHCSFDFFSEYFRPLDFEGIYICIEDKMIINYLMLKVPYVDINLVKQYIKKVSLNLCTETSDQVLSFFENSTTLLNDDKYSGILNALIGQPVPDHFKPYIGQILEELLKLEDVDIISKFTRPNGCLVQEKNAVSVDNDILAKRLLNILVGTSSSSMFSPNDSYNDFANTCDEQCIFNEAGTIGRYLYRVGLQPDGKNFVEKVLSMVEEHITNIHITNINPIILKYMIDGFTGSGHLKDVVSQYKIFCERYFFIYGSIYVVLNLCCPSSFAGSSNTFVKVDNRLLAKKLLSHLTVQRQEINEDSDDNDRDSDDREYDYNQYDDNESDDYDSDFCNPLVEAVGEYVYTFGIEKNDEKFMKKITSELFYLLVKRDSEGVSWKNKNGRYLDRNLCKHFLYKGLDCEENREKIKQFPDFYAFIDQFKL